MIIILICNYVTEFAQVINMPTSLISVSRPTSKVDGQAHQRTGEPSTGQPPVSSADLLRGHKTVAIAHNGMLYTLQTTKLGKLILTK
jgi:hemin uptake protein HemP